MFVKFLLKLICFTLLSSLSLDSVILSNSKPALKRDIITVNKTGLSTLPKSLAAASNLAILPSPVKPFIKKIIVNNLLKNKIKTYPSFSKSISVNELSDFEITFVTSSVSGIKSITSSAMFDGWANIRLLAPITVHSKTNVGGKLKTDLSITRSFETPIKTYYYSKIRFTIALENTEGRTTKQIVEFDVN